MQGTSGAEYRRGFTLLEVAVAMAIVGLGVVTLLEIFSLGLRLEGRSSARTEAVTYGRQIIDEAFISGSGEERAGEGSFAEKYHWTLRVRPLQVEAKAFSQTPWELKEIGIEITYRDGDREKKVEMKTLRLFKRAAQ